MDVNEPEAGGSAAGLRLGLRTALFSLEWTVRRDWLQREGREILRGKVISLSFYKGEWRTWAADWGLSQSKAPILSLIHYFLCAVLSNQTLIWCLSVKYPPWKVIFVTINLMHARDTTAFYIKLFPLLHSHLFASKTHSLKSLVS